MLTQIIIENFKSIKSGEVSDLGKVNVIIGRNNSGKSCILDALCLAKYACGRSPQMFNEPLPMILLRRRGMERSYYTVRNFWHNYDTKNTISFKLGFKNGEKLNIEIGWVDSDQLDVYLQDLSGGIPALISGKHFAKIRTHMSAGFSS
ncbi:MAG: AAA family ATPase [Candidatus Bathyarchaeia archaeon]